MEIIDRISELLLQKGKSAYYLCKILDISQSTMSTWRTRRKNPPAEYMETIASYLGVSLDYLMTGREAPQYKYTTEDEDDLLELFRSLPDKRKYMFIGELKEAVRVHAESVKHTDGEKRLLA